MDKLALLKANLGISTAVRDDYLNSILDSVCDELKKEKGIALDEKDNIHLMFIVDYAAWRFRNRGEGAMPRNIQYRLHNLLIHSGGDDTDDLG